jgi:hypothetical protein
MNWRRNRRDLRGLVHRPGDDAGQHGGAEGPEFEGEVGDDAEVPTPAPQRPEELGVFLCAGHDEVPLGGDHITGAEAVDGEAELAH